jgi:enoyl-CoA hydratase/carnithine racemase
MLSLAIFEVRKPVIAAINGPAVGVGATMTLPMDIRMIADTAKMGFVFARRGIAPEACSTYFLPRIVGISQAAEWVYTGRVFSAQEAFEKRLVSRILPPDQLLPAARELALEIAQNTSAISVALSRQMLWRMLGVDHPMEAHKIESRAINALGKAPDAFEGVSSFLEKRAPNFTQKPSSDMPDFFPGGKIAPSVDPPTGSPAPPMPP